MRSCSSRADPHSAGASQRTTGSAGPASTTARSTPTLAAITATKHSARPAIGPERGAGPRARASSFLREHVLEEPSSPRRSCRRPTGIDAAKQLEAVAPLVILPLATAARCIAEPGHHVPLGDLLDP